MFRYGGYLSYRNLYQYGTGSRYPTLLMCCLRSEAIQKRLLTEKALTLDRAVETSVSMEMAAKEAHQLSSSTTLHKIANETYEKQIKCYSCDKMGHIDS